MWLKLPYFLNHIHLCILLCFPEKCLLRNISVLSFLSEREGCSLHLDEFYSLCCAEGQKIKLLCYLELSELPVLSLSQSNMSSSPVSPNSQNKKKTSKALTSIVRQWNMTIVKSWIRIRFGRNRFGYISYSYHKQTWYHFMEHQTLKNLGSTHIERVTLTPLCLAIGNGRKTYYSPMI